MAFSLWKSVQQSLSGAALKEIEKQAGADEKQTRHGIRHSIPAIVQSLVRATRSDDGTAMLENELALHDGSVLKNLYARISGEKRQEFVADGKDLFDAFAGAEAAKITSSISRKCGIGAGSARRMLGTMTPVVVGALAKHRKTARLDTTQFKVCLDEQLVEIEKAGASFLPDPLNSISIGSLVMTAHDEFGPGEKVTKDSLAHRLDMTDENATRLYKELQSRKKINPSTGYLVDAPAIAERLVARVPKEIGEGKEVTAPLLKEHFGVRERRAKSLLADLKSRGVVTSTGLLSNRAGVAVAATGHRSTVAADAGTTAAGSSGSSGSGNTSKAGGSVSSSSSAVSSSNAANSTNDQEGGGFPWWVGLLPLLLIAGLIALGLVWMNGRSDVKGEDDVTAVQSDGAGDSEVAAGGESLTLVAADGEIDADANETEQPSATDNAISENASAGDASAHRRAVATSAALADSSESASADKNASEKITSLLQKITNQLGTIDNVSTAKESIPKLSGWKENLDTIGTTASEWDGELRTEVNNRLFKLLPAFDASVETMFANEQVKEVLSEPVDELLVSIGNLIPADE